MSVDGPGILASDLGHDVYHEIISLYDAGTSVGEIRKRIGEFERNLADDMDREIYLAASAKALWEIGNLDESRLANLSRLVESGTSLSLWRESAGTALERARKAALTRLLRRIATPRKSPRPRKKPAQIKYKVFQLGDCLELSVDSGTYHAVVCEIRENPGWLGYNILLMSPDTGSEPKDYAAGSYFGRLIPSTQGSLRGPHVAFLAHRELIRNGNPFRTVGRVPLDPTKYVPGTVGVVGAIDELATHFDRIIAHADLSEPFSDVLLPLRELTLES